MTTAPPREYPKKLFYKIQEVANIVGVEPYVLRYWETKFPMLSPDKDGADQRRYRQKDIELILRIRELLYEEKYTIAGAVARLKEERSGGAAPAPRARQSAASAASEQGDFLEQAPEPVGEPIAELTEDQREKLQRIKDELGLLKRELETWRDEMEG